MTLSDDIKQCKECSIEYRLEKAPATSRQQQELLREAYLDLRWIAGSTKEIVTRQVSVDIADKIKTALGDV